MSDVSDLCGRIECARGLAELLDVAYQAFEEVLSLIRQHDDPGSDEFIPMVLAGASAANGRDYIGSAPSLPPDSPEPGQPEHKPFGASAGVRRGSAESVARLCRTLAAGLDAAAGSAPSAADRRVCAAAAMCAREIFGMVSGLLT